jgi:hypothetical protein
MGPFPKISKSFQKFPKFPIIPKVPKFSKKNPKLVNGPEIPSVFLLGCSIVLVTSDD